MLQLLVGETVDIRVIPREAVKLFDYLCVIYVMAVVGYHVHQIRRLFHDVCQFCGYVVHDCLMMLFRR